MPHREIPGVSKRVAGRMWTLSCSPGAAGVSQTSVRPKLWVPTVTPSPQGILGGGRVTTQASQRALVVKNLPAMQETEEMRVGPLGHEDPLEEEMAATPVFLPGKSHGQRSWRVTALGATQSYTTVYIQGGLLAFLDTTDATPPLTSQGPDDKENAREREIAKQLISTFAASKDDSVCKRLNPEAFVNKWLPKGRALGI